MSVKNFGVDLSKHNDIRDYDKLVNYSYKGAKIKFAFLRLGWLGKVDERFKLHYAGLRGKIKLGVYFYSYARSVAEAKQEAHWVIEQLRGVTLEFPVVFDYEDAKVLSPKLSRDEYTAICKAFLDEVQAAGYYVMLYSNPAFLESYAHKDALLKYPLWLAHYVPDGSQRQYGQAIWQFGTVTPDGAAAPVDGNWAYEQLGKIIRDGGYNKPPKRYIVTGSKTVTEDKRTATENQLRAQGFEVTTSEA